MIVPVVFGARYGDTTVKFVTLTRLNEKQFRFAGKCGTLVGREGTPQALWFVCGVAGVNDTKFAVRQDGHYETVRLGVILLCNLNKIKTTNVTIRNTMYLHCISHCYSSNHLTGKRP